MSQMNQDIVGYEVVHIEKKLIHFSFDWQIENLTQKMDDSKIKGFPLQLIVAFNGICVVKLGGILNM